MNRTKVCCAGATPAIRHAKEYLKNAGIVVTEKLQWDSKHLLLDVPSFRNGKLRSGATVDTLIEALPKDIHIWGGNLDHPALQGYHTTDLLKDEAFLAENAAITADCALKIASPLLHTTLNDTKILIIGWGRIGKCLGQMLKFIGADPIIAARDPAHRAALMSLGYRCADTAHLDPALADCRLIFNTVPHPVISGQQLELCPGAIQVDLASKQGIAGSDVIWARGLPGIHAPETSGKLIAKTIIRRLEEDHS